MRGGEKQEMRRRIESDEERKGREEMRDRK